MTRLMWCKYTALQDHITNSDGFKVVVLRVSPDRQKDGHIDEWDRNIMPVEAAIHFAETQSCVVVVVMTSPSGTAYMGDRSEVCGRGYPRTRIRRFSCGRSADPPNTFVDVDHPRI